MNEHSKQLSDYQLKELIKQKKVVGLFFYLFMLLFCLLAASAVFLIMFHSELNLFKISSNLLDATSSQSKLEEPIIKDIDNSVSFDGYLTLNSRTIKINFGLNNLTKQELDSALEQLRDRI